MASILNSARTSPAVFLDRDGTLMEDVEYCGDPARVAVFAGAAQALARLRTVGFRLVMVTNQSGIGRGYFSEEDFQKVQTEVFRQLGGDVSFDGVYHCPDRPESASERRKPAPGMILDAATDLALDLPRSYMIGDSWADVECGRRAGVAATVFVVTGKGAGELSRCQPDFVAADLSAAVDWIVQKENLPNG